MAELGIYSFRFVFFWNEYAAMGWCNNVKRFFQILSLEIPGFLIVVLFGPCTLRLFRNGQFQGVGRDDVLGDICHLEEHLWGMLVCVGATVGYQ